MSLNISFSEDFMNEFNELITNNFKWMENFLLLVSSNNNIVKNFIYNKN